MSAARWRGAVLVACGLGGLGIAPGRVEGAEPTVLLVAPPGTRLAGQLARELAASGFSFVRAEGSRPRGSSPCRGPEQVARGVFVGPEDRWVVAVACLPSGETFARLELPVDAEDDLSRRRACLTVVEYLRVLIKTETPAPPAPPAARVRPAPDPAPVSPEAVETLSRQEIPPPEPSPWITGVATTIDHSSALGPIGYLQFIWEWMVGTRVRVRARGEWPLWGGEQSSSDGTTRILTFGAGANLHYVLGTPAANLRPYVGVAGGARLLLTEFRDLTPLDHVTYTTSVNLGVQAGVAYRLSPAAQLFFESGAARQVLVPIADRPSYVTAAANAIALSSSIGVTFEY
jgi:hypothetical protein